jgi:cystathionine beta-lyase
MRSLSECGLQIWIFATPQVIIDGIKERLDKKIFGYTRILSDSYY